jgi:phospholipid transport system substrate-binding protein
MKNLWIGIVITLIMCQVVSAGKKEPEDSNCPNDPNELSQVVSACKPVPSRAEGKEREDPNYPSDPNELIRTKWNAVISVLKNKDLNQEARIKKINKIVNPIFDFPLMAKLALGREHWPKLTKAQQEKFTKLFVERLRTSYREKIALYTNEEVVFKPAKRKKSIIYIPMELTTKDKKIAILHKLRKVDKHWKIYDVEIQGISILLTYRSQFDDILSKGTVEDLLSRLAEPPKQ